MNVVFICGSLELGKDGVGDYTRRLAGELRRCGHQSYLIALNDKYISNSEETTQESEGVIIPVLRISYLEAAYKKYFLAHEKIQQNDPQWLSLQFVPYSFHRKGLPWHLGNQLARLGKGRKWHVMFHELWVGMDKESPIKHKIVGRLQRYIIKKDLALLEPAVITTQSSIYQKQLLKMGQNAKLLPLFGNIPVGPADTAKRNDQTLNFLVFGMIQPKAPFASFAKEVRDYSRNLRKNVKFIFVGRNGKELDKWVKICKRNCFEVEVFGEQNTNEISRLILQSQWGITSTPYLQSEKSGTVAAMREHNLPIYCVSRSWNPAVTVPKFTSDIKEYKPNRLELEFPSFINYKSNQLERIAKLFSRNLMFKTYS